MAEDLDRRLPQVLLPWYMANRRALPWRQDREPYHVWLSEIMLQQTRVEAVKGYYSRFLEALPTLEALARCEDEQLHKLWEGLGYYTRVRNLKKAAQVIVEEYGGVFPREYPKVLALPGIGEYTAGAICSICFQQPIPAVDGNVLRVVSRLTNDDTPIDQPAFKRKARQALAAIYPPQAGEFTQALMELGATVCGPNRPPQCHSCPCRTFCQANLRGEAQSLPVKSRRKPRKVEEKTVFILSCQGRFALKKREDTGLLAGLWQFPDRPGKLELPQAIQAVEAMGLQVRDILRQTERRHIFTHVQWEMTGYYMELERTGGGFAWLSSREIREYAALPTAYRQFWEDPEDTPCALAFVPKL